jgi:hypothetical protein
MTAVTQTAASALKTYLEATVGAAVTTYNAARRPELLSKVGPFWMPAQSCLTVAEAFEVSDYDPSSIEIGWIAFDVAPGSYTAAELVAENPVFATVPSLELELSATTDGRLRLRYSSAQNAYRIRLLDRVPDSFTTYSVANALFGWDAGGEIVSSPELVAPTMRSICDGFPAFAPDMQAGMWLIIGDREASPVGDSSLRRDVWEVRLPLHVMLPVRADAHHRSRTAIAGAVGMLEDLLLSTAGRYLGRQSAGDVIGVEVLSERIEAQPIRGRSGGFGPDCGRWVAAGRSTSPAGPGGRSRGRWGRRSLRGGFRIHPAGGGSR